ncbi:peptide ABC transporter permease [Anaerocolumna cellulosilytica]|uniref:Peptide ABC transporter permease n=1 Tax=Anaerocolumna cellulosilytica TaxID=433286 RepID=A0A6S6QX06_9FIRM|nr:ABC transporter permease [Anaerocolumna cellulosilytica]MBB5196854.1 peptide/nickel transport system permease protein [Anaerocolumna cellulosilytica]BCJ95753.1 peptide ABC transporter permease [Anaerocolumna cellulosilytica]
MIKYISKRIMFMVFVFFIMSLVMFFLYNLIPGDPARAELEPIKNTLTLEEYQRRYESLRAQMGLDDPTIVKYGKWIGGVLQGDLGNSIRYKKPVIDLVKEPMKNTIFINIFAMMLALGITIPLGIICAVKRNSLFDNSVQVGTIVGYSLPPFIIALISIFLFAVTLGWFPVSGMNTPNFKGTGLAFFVDRMYHLALPLFVMTLSSLGGMTRYVRAAMIESLRMDYIRTARAKGLREKVVIYSHAWRNALLPVITLIIGWFINIFAGSLVVEEMFSLNGMGSFYMDALRNQDYNIALAVQMFYMIVALVGNLVIDLSYGLVDPRVRVNR